MRIPNKRDAGQTLLELIMAVGIVGIIITALVVV